MPGGWPIRGHDARSGRRRESTPGRDHVVWPNETDKQRAEILRYRLYTYQPDEMVTMMALAP